MKQGTLKDLSKDQLEHFLTVTGFGSYVYPIPSASNTVINFSKSYLTQEEMYKTVILPLDNKTRHLVKEELFNRKVGDVLNES